MSFFHWCTGLVSSRLNRLMFAWILLVFSMISIVIGFSIFDMSNYQEITARQSVNHVAAIRAWILRYDSNNIDSKLAQFRHGGVMVSIAKKRPLGAGLILPDSEGLLSLEQYSQLINNAIDHSRVVISTRLHNGLWLSVAAVELVKPHLLISLLIIVMVLVALSMLWLVIFVYYRRGLPADVMGSIEGDKRKSDQMISYLTQRIRDHFHEKNLMLTALSHDIRTPLTEAMLSVELLEDQSLVERLKGNLDQIQGIINSSLEFSKPPERINKLSVEMVSFIESIADRYQSDQFEIKLVMMVEEYEWLIEVDLFRRLIVNLFDNAKKYASGCCVTLSVNNALGNLVLRIEDNGPGVPKETLDSLAKPYFRVDQSRSRHTGGTGLGLAIVKKIAQLHNGRVDFFNSNSGGFVVEMTFLPKSQADQLP